MTSSARLNAAALPDGLPVIDRAWTETMLASGAMPAVRPAMIEATAVPLFRQVAGALKASGYPFTVFTPGGSVRLSSDRKPEDYIELSLDTTNLRPQVIVHSSRSRGRRVTESEIAVGRDGPVRELTEEDVLSVVLRVTRVPYAMFSRQDVAKSCR